jgi:hypothetical protein
MKTFKLNLNSYVLKAWNILKIWSVNFSKNTAMLLIQKSNYLSYKNNISSIEMKSDLKKLNSRPKLNGLPLK